MTLAEAVDDPRALKWALGLAVSVIVWLGKRAIRPYERMPSMLYHHVKWLEYLEGRIGQLEEKAGLPVQEPMRRRLKDIEWETCIALGKTPGPRADPPRERWPK